ncbi:MAG: tRNA pseudouridine(54/55) synthase Pus10 [Candidatus Thermoplasmatota archaeon]
MSMEGRLELIKKIRIGYRICDKCILRLFKRNTDEDGLKKLTGYLNKDKKNKEECYICEGLLEEIPVFTGLIEKKLEGYEFNTFLIGSKVDEEIVNKEREVVELLDLKDAEPLKMELNREIGKNLERITGKTVDFNDPDVTAVIDTGFNVVTLQVKSLYIYGRYLKYERGIPQTKWPCRVCRGVGCRACGYTGRLYDTSVEEIISSVAIPITGAVDASFHGCGREDIDARMLGNGRPFVLELKQPRRRTIDLKELERGINKNAGCRIKVINLRYSDQGEVVRLKNADYRKVYDVLIESEQVFIKEKVKKVAGLLPSVTIKQFTPSRVAHRRALTVRERKVYNCEVQSVEGNIARLIIETESGTYIKELVSGDNGKTQPSISEMLGVPCRVKELDVIEVKGE